MAYRPYFKKGDWLAICESCGRKFKASSLKKRWDGLMVCKEDWETRHPQEFVRGKADKQSVPWTRPEAGDVYILSCDLVTTQAAANIGTAGCARAGNYSGYTYPNVPGSSLAIAGYLIAGIAISGRHP